MWFSSVSAPCGAPLSDYVEHFHAERNYPGKANVLLFPRDQTFTATAPCNAASDWVGSRAIIIKS